MAVEVNQVYQNRKNVNRVGKVISLDEKNNYIILQVSGEKAPLPVKKEAFSKSWKLQTAETTEAEAEKPAEVQDLVSDTPEPEASEQEAPSVKKGALDVSKYLAMSKKHQKKEKKEASEKPEGEKKPKQKKQKAEDDPNYVDPFVEVLRVLDKNKKYRYTTGKSNVVIYKDDEKVAVLYKRKHKIRIYISQDRFDTVTKYEDKYEQKGIGNYKVFKVSIFVEFADIEFMLDKLFV